MTAAPNARSPLAALAWAAAATLYGVLFLGAESERALGTLLAIAAAGVVLGARFGLVDRIRASIGGNERAFDIAAVAGAPLTRVTRRIVVGVTDGMLDLKFVPIKGDAIVSGIEITR